MMSILEATATETGSNLSSASELLAPPFKYRFRSPDPAGFWTAVGLDPWKGGVVMQLGAKPHSVNTPLTRGELNAGFHWEGWLQPGFHNFSVRFELVSVTRKPRGGVLQTSVFTTFAGRPQMQEVSGGGICYMSAAVFSVGQVYGLEAGGLITSQFQGSADPYAEIIIGRIELVRSFSGWAATAGTAESGHALEAVETGDAPAATMPGVTIEEIDLDQLSKQRLAEEGFDTFLSIA